MFQDYTGVQRFDESYGYKFPLKNLIGSFVFGVTSFILNNLSAGEVTERLKVPVLKTGEDSRPPWVQIPPSPPYAVKTGPERSVGSNHVQDGQPFVSVLLQAFKTTRNEGYETVRNQHSSSR